MDQDKKYQSSKAAAIIFFAAAAIFATCNYSSCNENKTLNKKVWAQIQTIDSLGNKNKTQENKLNWQGAKLIQDSTTIAVYKQSINDISDYSNKIIQIINAVRK